jgi:transcriptional regulator with XRE-family HTH domain
MDPVIPVVKRNLRVARSRLDISQREAARRAGISKSVLEKYESTENDRIPNTRQLYRLAEAYQLSIDYLLGRSEVIEVQHRRFGTRAVGRSHANLSIVGV